jgi:hypothetical protein
VAGRAQGFGELAEEGDPLGEHEAVSSSAQGRGDISGDLADAVVIGDQVAVDRGRGVWKPPKSLILQVTHMALPPEAPARAPGR